MSPSSFPSPNPDVDSGVHEEIVVGGREGGEGEGEGEGEETIMTKFKLPHVSSHHHTHHHRKKKRKVMIILDDIDILYLF